MPVKNIKLSAEEQDLLASFEAGEWSSVADLHEKKAEAKTAARRFLTKSARINIRLSSNDLRQLKEKAALEGMAYQTLISSILHKYACGHQTVC